MYTCSLVLVTSRHSIQVWLISTQCWSLDMYSDAACESRSRSPTTTTKSRRGSLLRGISLAVFLIRKITTYKDVQGSIEHEKNWNAVKNTNELIQFTLESSP